MNNEIKIFENTQLGNLRCWWDDKGNVCFLATDVAQGLGYSSTGAMTRTLDEDEKGVQIVHTLGGDQKMVVINESGFYHAALKSRVEKAKAFRKWVTAEVLPQIRKTGGYIPVKEEDDEKTILCKALMIYKRTIEEKEALLEQQRPKVEYCDDVLMSEDCVTTTQVAKHFGLSAIALNNKLHELKIQFKQSGQWHLYARFAKMGLTKERTSPYYDSEGCIHTSVLTVWTERGKRFISELIRCGYDLDLALVKIISPS